MSRLNDIIFWGGFGAGLVGSYRHFDKVLQQVILQMSSSSAAHKLISSSPMTKPVVSQFVAGETNEEAIVVARTLNEAGMRVSLDYLGESVNFSHEAVQAREEICELLDHASEAAIDANVSIKLTQLGLKLNRDLAFDNLITILERAKQHGNWVRIDMEESEVTQATIDVFERAIAAGCDNVGLVVQAYLYRTAADVEWLIEMGARVRLCKGAYAESAEVAFPEKAQIDNNYIRLAHMLLSDYALSNGVIPAFATHDDKMIQAVINFVKENDIAKDKFEFQMLYGVRSELQQHLVSEGYKVRIYVPFGSAWYPYLMRRLAEKPQNVQLILKNL